MTWEEYALARQLLVEEHVGTLIREARRAEDHAAKQARKNVGRR